MESSRLPFNGMLNLSINNQLEADKIFLSRLGSQSQRRIYFILPTLETSQIIGVVCDFRKILAISPELIRLRKEFLVGTVLGGLINGGFYIRGGGGWGGGVRDISQVENIHDSVDQNTYSSYKVRAPLRAANNPG